MYKYRILIIAHLINIWLLIHETRKNKIYLGMTDKYVSYLDLLVCVLFQMVGNLICN